VLMSFCSESVPVFVKAPAGVLRHSMMGLVRPTSVSRVFDS
jgi:hypothetical protein